MNFDAWIVDLPTLSATHESGFRIEVEGNPRDPQAVNPGRFPKEFTGIEQVRLLRVGVEAIAKAAKQQLASKAERQTQPVVPVRKPSQSGRPVLSLKKKASEKTTREIEAV
jgi:hypothetical protein